jgi:hypothetical protein
MCQKSGTLIKKINNYCIYNGIIINFKEKKMDEEVIIRPNIKKRHFTDAKVLCVDGIAIDENGFVLDESLGKVEDIRKLPRKGGCGIGSDGLSFEQVLDNLDRKALKEQEERRAAEQKAQEERLKQEEQEINRLRSLSEKDLLVELVLLLKNVEYYHNHRFF